MHTLALELEPEQFLSGWRPEARLLFIPALSEARPGDPAAVRIGIARHPIRATVFGRVSSVRRVGRPSLPPGAELSMDPGSLPALGFLTVAARGGEVTFHDREPRWVVKRHVILLRGAERISVPTVNVSSRGCAIEWSGAPPGVGETLRLKVRPGLLKPVAQAVVCWSALGRRSSAVGLRLVSSGRASRSWGKMAAEAQRSGAPSI